MDFDSARRIAGLRYIWEESETSPFEKPVPAGENGVADTEYVDELTLEQTVEEIFFNIISEQLLDDAL